MGPTGIEPATFSVSKKRSTTELWSRFPKKNIEVERLELSVLRLRLAAT